MENNLSYSWKLIISKNYQASFTKKMIFNMEMKINSQEGKYHAHFEGKNHQVIIHSST